jgi:hypothetical protein
MSIAQFDDPRRDNQSMRAAYTKTIEGTTMLGTSVVNITGASLTFTISDENDVVLLTKTVGSGITITDAANGVFEIVITDTDTTSTDIGKYYHSIVYEPVSGGKYLLAYGIFDIK